MASGEQDSDVVLLLNGILHQSLAHLSDDAALAAHPFDQRRELSPHRQPPLTLPASERAPSPSPQGTPADLLDLAHKHWRCGEPVLAPPRCPHPPPKTHDAVYPPPTALPDRSTQRSLSYTDEVLGQLHGGIEVYVSWGTKAGTLQTVRADKDSLTFGGSGQRIPLSSTAVVKVASPRAAVQQGWFKHSISVIAREGESDALSQPLLLTPSDEVQFRRMHVALRAAGQRARRA
ncbi:hypothetical protein BU26DRAFT_566733 [Trematosphaeria pertusa]|uniref:Uncharacterized protein n=1 Tax=Trematosphaeria pertusa TaxID=390896 RepID=A0A6A6IBK8_9PLEO|nr:uncharacterized protein BU26DRAFT_566733 [Trematosphaeria pertusa]KAF2247786.1 hypothetical protein BU26DRAFT_566733 [Trematosphaeria pertusa]